METLEVGLATHQFLMYASLILNVVFMVAIIVFEHRNDSKDVEIDTLKKQLAIHERHQEVREEQMRQSILKN